MSSSASRRVLALALAGLVAVGATACTAQQEASPSESAAAGVPVAIDCDTLITPEAWIRSATTNAANGTTSEIAVSMSGSVRRLRSIATTRKKPNPMASPPPAASRKSSATRVVEMPSPWAEAPRPPAAMAVRRATRAVASLSSDSPSRMVTMRRGRPMLRPIAVAATASGGATTAPRADAAGQVTAGMTL